MRRFGPVKAFGLGVLAGAVLAAAPASAQYDNPTTPGAIANPGSYQGSLALQQQERESSAQMQQQNAAMQQRLDQTYSAYSPRGGGRAGPPPVNWLAKPPLPAAKNPLLGRWRQGALRGISNRQLGVVADMANTMFAGGCESMFGKGVVEFAPDALNWVAPDGHTEILNHVAYRASGADVVVISREPGGITLFFGFPNHDHAVVAFLGCGMDRLGAHPTPPAGVVAANTVRAPGPAVPAAPIPAGAAVISLTVGVMDSGVFQPFSGAKVWVTADDPAASLNRAGAAPGSSAVARVAAGCGTPQNCNLTFYSMTGNAADTVRTDAGGHAQTKPIAPGRYYLVGVVPYQAKAMVWAQAVNLQPGANVVRLDQSNGQAVR